MPYRIIVWVVYRERGRNDTGVVPYKVFAYGGRRRDAEGSVPYNTKPVKGVPPHPALTGHLLLGILTGAFSSKFAPHRRRLLSKGSALALPHYRMVSLP